MGAPIPPIFAALITIVLLLLVVFCGVAVLGAVYALYSLWKGD